MPAFADWGAEAATESPGTEAPKPSTYTSPQWPPSEQPAATISISTVSPTMRATLPGATSKSCQSV